jgi:hypothetical protein
LKGTNPTGPAFLRTYFGGLVLTTSTTGASLALAGSTRRRVSLDLLCQLGNFMVRN